MILLISLVVQVPVLARFIVRSDTHTSKYLHEDEWQQGRLRPIKVVTEQPADKAGLSYLEEGTYTFTLKRHISDRPTSNYHQRDNNKAS